MKLRGILASALAFALSVSLAFAQGNQGTSPLTPTKGGTNSAFVGFTGPASSIKTFTLPNASDTIATLAAIQTFTGAKTFASAKLLLAGSSSGAGTLNAPAVASTYVWTLPAATDTLVGRDTTDTLTNKTLTSPTLTAPLLGVATATTINKVAITAPAAGATLTIPDGVTLTGPASSGTAMTLGNTETVTGVKTFGSSGAVGRLKIAGTTSGSTVLDATAAASGTLTLPAATDTLVGKATTDTLTNKTISGSSNTLSNIATTALTGTLQAAQEPAHTGDMTNSAGSLATTVSSVTGTATNNSAAAGKVGEYIEGTGSAVAIVNNTAKSIASVTLTAGDWDVSGFASFAPAATTSTTYTGLSLSPTDNTLDTTIGRYVQIVTPAVVAGAGVSNNMATPPVRFSLSTTTILYAVVQAGFTVSTNSASAKISARRMR